MDRNFGKPTNCPNCGGQGKLNKRQCIVCQGEGRVEYQEKDGITTAPAGSWLPLRRRGQSGYIIVLFGGPKLSMTRD